MEGGDVPLVIVAGDVDPEHGPRTRHLPPAKPAPGSPEHERSPGREVVGQWGAVHILSWVVGLMALLAFNAFFFPMRPGGVTAPAETGPPPPPVPFTKTLYGSFLIGSVAAMLAEAVTYPFDSLKTRSHLKDAHADDDDVLAHPPQPSRARQLLSLYHGVGIACFRHIPYSGTRQMLFQSIKYSLASSGVLAASGSPMLVMLLVACLAGAVGQIVANPADVLKVRMQSDGRKIMQGQAPEYKSLVDACRRLWREEGFSGLTVGTVPNTVRSIFMNVGDLWVYDGVKAWAWPWAGKGLGAVAVGSAVCGFTTAVIANPAEVARNRMMNNGPTAPVVMYKTLWDCVVKTYREGGLVAFFKGIVPFYFRNGPWRLIFWMVFESLQAHLDKVVPAT